MSYHRVTVFNIGDAHRAETLQELAMQRFACQGIEEYSLDEPAVDALLGERSYSGGDLPLEVLAEVDEAMHTGNFHYKFFFADGDRAQAENFFVSVRNHFLCEAQLETFDDQDWNAEWKKHYSPIEVPGGLVVLPEWEDPAKHAGKLVVRIHPGMGFGTGSHETTFLCLKNFLPLIKELPKSERVLDYGSGSGILGLATLLALPEWKADMVDIDLEAHHNCSQNMELNKIATEKVALLLLDKRPSRQYPLVFANILQNILHEERDYLIDRVSPNGHILLSGLLSSQVDETIERYLSTQKVKLVVREIKNDWAAVVLRKNP